MTICKVSSRCHLYQFPMGKVKVRRISSNKCKVIPVSIPYGKGKEKEYNTMVKIVRVSIPYGKGKEQHLVLCFYYNT